MSATASALFTRASQRGGAWLVIAAIHLAALYGIMSWAPSFQALESAPIEAVILDMPSPATDTPPPPVPKLASPAVPVMEPPTITFTEDPPPNAITVAVAPAAPPPPPATGAPKQVTNVAYLQPPQPRYPPESRRSGERGVVILRVLIDELGHAARIEIERSSGFARLDDAARAAVQRAVFQPYVENGVPRTVLATIPIEFTWKARGAGKNPSRG